MALLTTPTLATEYYVQTTGSDDANGLSWDTAFATISHAITAASRLDTITLQSGTYYECLVFYGKEVRIRSTDPNDPSTAFHK